MSKRRQSTRSTASSTAYLVGTSSDEETDEEYAEEPPLKKSKVTSTKRRITRKETEQTPSLEGYVFKHPASLHQPTEISPLIPKLIEWYHGAKSARKMPWRGDYDGTLSREAKGQRAYEVLVSEVMLQQTQVATVIPYFNAWLTRFPTIHDLAAVDDIEEINKFWKGLGYYRRASSLLQAAKKIVSDFRGLIPRDPKILQKEIPGVGRYTAGAVTSIAYNVKAPAVDGNVFRLFSRLLALHSNPKSKQFQDTIWDAATTLVTSTDIPGDLNQAFIELGSTICKVTSPSCTSCPLSLGCGAYKQQQPSLQTEEEPAPAEGFVPDIEDACAICEPFPTKTKSVTRYPMKVPKKPPRDEHTVITIVEMRDDLGRWFLMSQRPNKGLLAGLWEFPTTELPGIMTPKSRTTATQNIVKRVLPCLGSIPFTHRVIGQFLHLFSHIKQTNHVTRVIFADIKRDDAVHEGCKWVLQEDFAVMNVGVGTTKAWEMVKNL